METPQKIAPAGNSGNDSDDISLINEEDEEELTPSAQPSPSGAVGLTASARTWAQVDPHQLKHLSLRIAQRVKSDGEKSDASARILGSSAPQAVPATMGMPPLATSIPSDARTHPSNAAYDPEIHAALAFGDVQWRDLLLVVERLRSEVTEHASQLKALVKENFERFISSKDTVDDVAARLRAAEAEGGAGVHGATPAEVSKGLESVQGITHAVFGQLLERRERVEGLERVLSLLEEYDGLVTLPSRLRSCAEARDFGGVVALYKKALKVVEERQGGREEAHAVWEKLREEVDRAMSSALHVLEATVDSPLTPPTAAFEAVAYLSQLQQLNVPAASGLDSLGMYLASQKRAVGGTIDGLYRQFQESTMTMTQSGLEQASKINEWPLPPGATGFPALNDQFLLAPTPAAECLYEMTHVVVGWLLEFWSTTMTVKSTIGSGMWKGRIEEAKRVVADVLDMFSKAALDVTRAHLEARSKGAHSGCGGGGGGGSLEPATELIAGLVQGCTELEKAHGKAPSNALKLLRTLVSQMVADIGTAEQHLLCSKARRLATAPLPRATATLPSVAALNLLLSQSMRLLEDIQSMAARAGVRSFDSSSLWHPSKVVWEGVLAYASSAVDRAQSEVAVDNISSSGSSKTDHNHLLLQVWATLEAVKSSTVPQVAAAWEPLLTSGCPAPQVTAALRKCCQEVDVAGESLVKVWMDKKLEQLDLIMEEFLAPVVPPEKAPPHAVQRDARALAASWPAAAEPYAARPATWKLITALGGLRAELGSYAPALRHEVMAEVVHSVLGGVAELLNSGLLKDAPVDAVYQLWIDLTVVKAAVVELGEEVGDGGAMAEKLCTAVEQALRTCLGEAKKPDLTAPSMADRQRRVEEVCAAEIDAAEGVMASLRALER